MMAQGGSSNSNAVLKEIYAKYISITDAEKRENVKVVEFIKEVMIPLMKKQDILFDAMFHLVYHSGSYYTGLRVNNANEFDLNFLLKLPIIDDSCIQFNEDNCHPGFTNCAIVGNLQDIIKPNFIHFLPLLKSHILQNDMCPHRKKGIYLLKPGGLRQWLQSIVSRVLADHKLTQSYSANNIRCITPKTSGPAITLVITLVNGTQIDVDIVPIFRFNCRKILHLKVIGAELTSYWNKQGQRGHSSSGGLSLDDNFSVVPKTKNNLLHLPMTIISYQWRLDFIDIEKRILYQMGCLKMVVKLLKYFRDCNHVIQGLSSYSIKTVVMLCIKEYPSYAWHEEKLSLYFLFALKKLNERLEQKCIPFYFHPNSNLLDNFEDRHVGNMQRWLAHALIRLEKSNNTEECSSTWNAYFCKSGHL